MSVACGRIHPGHERFSDDPQGRQMIFQCLAAHSQYSLPVDALNVIVKAGVKRRTSHEPNRMLMRDNKGFFSHLHSIRLM